MLNAYFCKESSTGSLPVRKKPLHFHNSIIFVNIDTCFDAWQVCTEENYFEIGFRISFFSFFDRIKYQIKLKIS